MKANNNKYKFPAMALFPPTSKNRPSWKLLPALLLLIIIFAFLLFRDSSSSVSKSAPENRLPQQIVSLATPEIRLPEGVMTALVHYATSETIPQQTRQEISLTARVLARRGPCNMLVFGLGHDSLMWKNLNHGGRTVFLEENDDWIRKISESFPDLESHLVEYPTTLTESEELLRHARENRKGKCSPVQNLLLSECKLALYNLPNEIAQLEWDVIMVDGPRGYFDQAPGRMAAIFSAGVMARSRRSGNGTDVFVHDVERPVEKIYSEEFLCQENLVEESESKHLWHFLVSPSPPERHEFCSSSSSSPGA